MKIALVTEELAVVGPSGGIGAAIFELAVVLAGKGHDIDVLYYPIKPVENKTKTRHIEYFLSRGVRLEFVDGKDYVWDQSPPSHRAYVVYQHLKKTNYKYDVIHFHDYKGMGFFCCTAKHQGIAFLETTLVVQLHGPTRWTIHANRGLFTNPDQLVVDHLERESIRLADKVVSPSAYLIDWLGENGSSLPNRSGVCIIKNVFGEYKLPELDGTQTLSERIKIKHLLFFGRHEPRKGLAVFCDALDRASGDLIDHGVSVTFVGGFGQINGQPSGVYLSERSKCWHFPISFRVDLNRLEAQKFLQAQRNTLIVMPSSAENSPYTVLEAISSGCPILTSCAGGAKELIDPRNYDECIVEMNADALSDRISHLIRNGARRSEYAENFGQVVQKWVDFHETCIPSKLDKSTRRSTAPKVVIGITHYERPHKVITAIMSALRQTYRNIEIVVVDDGSSSFNTLEALNQIEQLLVRVGGRLIRRSNGYLGAARNTIAAHTQSDYIIFLDDDDILMPHAVESLINSALTTGADIINCLNVFLEFSARSDYELCPELHHRKVSYVPLGGPLSISHLANMFGAATALLKREFFERINGYTEIRGVGFEDYELYVRAAQAGADIRIFPEPLYLYEVGKPSMVSGTSRITNKLRVIEALDLKTSPAAWRDSIEIAAGLYTLDDQDNYWNWTYSNSPHHAIIDRILATRDNLFAHLDALVEYARAIGSPAAVVAWQEALHNLSSKSNSANHVAQHRIGRTIHWPESAADGYEITLNAELIALISLNRFDEAVSKIVDYLESRQEISRSTIEFVFIIVESRHLAPPVAEKLLSYLTRMPVDEGLLNLLRGAVGCLAIIASDYVEAKSQIDAVVKSESNDYVTRYRDVHSAFGEQSYEVALKHFDVHGRVEGRTGFASLTRTIQVVSKLYGMSIRASDISGSLNHAIKSGHVFEETLRNRPGKTTMKSLFVSS